MTSAELRDLGAIDGPLLVFGGVYGNLEALTALLARARDLGIPPDRMIHTGDVIAYGADPDGCAWSLRDLGCPAIRGNVEEQLAAGAEDCNCGFGDGTACDLLSARWYAFAAARVDADLRRWMGTLPAALTFSMSGVSFRVVHGGTTGINHFLYGAEPDAAFSAELAAVAEDVVIGGHRGFAFARALGARAWINGGALGLPMDDGTARVWFAVIEPDANGPVVRFEPLAYDHETAIAKLRAAGLPEPYAVAMAGGPLPNRATLPEPLRAVCGTRRDPAPFALKAAIAA